MRWQYQGTFHAPNLVDATRSYAPMSQPVRSPARCAALGCVVAGGIVTQPPYPISFCPTMDFYAPLSQPMIPPPVPRVPPILLFNGEPPFPISFCPTMDFYAPLSVPVPPPVPRVPPILLFNGEPPFPISFCPTMGFYAPLSVPIPRPVLPIASRWFAPYATPVIDAVTIICRVGLRVTETSIGVKVTELSVGAKVTETSIGLIVDDC